MKSVKLSTTSKGGKLSVKVTNHKENACRWSIVDLKGNVLRKGSVKLNDKGEFEIDIVGVNSGNYIFSIENNEDSVSHHKLKIAR